MSAPYFPFYPADFIADTVDLTPGEVGTYLRLLCFQWKKGSVPDDTKTIMRIAGCTEAEANAVRPYFERICERNANAYADEMREVYVLVNPRLKQEFDQMVEKSSKASESAKKRWKHSSSAYDDANAMRTHMPTHSEGISERNAIQISDIRDNTLSLSPVRAHTREELPVSEVTVFQPDPVDWPRMRYRQQPEEQPKGAPELPGTFEIPSLEKVIEYANTRGFGPDVAERYFDMRAADGWLKSTKGGEPRPIADWYADFRLNASKIRAELSKPAEPVRPSRNGMPDNYSRDLMAELKANPPNFNRSAANA